MRRPQPPTRPGLSLLVLAVLAAPHPAETAVLTVDTTVDFVDFAGAQQAADLPGPDGLVSFREATIAANNTTGPDTIAFQIPLGDPGFVFGQYFQLTVSSSINSGLFLTDDGTTIDGLSQTAFTGDTNPAGPEISFSGTVLSTSSNGITVNSDGNSIVGIGSFLWFRYGIQLNGDGNVVRGCVTSNPLSAGVEIRGANNVVGGLTPGDGNELNSSGVGVWIRTATAVGNVVQGNLISGNHGSGVVIESPATGNVIGGPDPAARNVINSSGHLSSESHPVGEQVGVAADGNTVQGNFLGVNETGTLDQSGSAKNGVYIRGSNNLVLDNVISGHGFTARGHREGVNIHGGSDNVVQGNRIGTDVTGTIPIPNETGIEIGIFLFNDVPRDVVIGGTGPGEGNVISGNDEDGIDVLTVGGSAPTGITISGNSIFGNGEEGIDLTGDGVTANDPGDLDTGANELMNFPVIGSASDAGTVTMVAGSIDTPSPATVTLEFFTSAAADPSGFGEGETFQASMVPNPDGTFVATLPGGLAGQFVTATATDALGNTSELSGAVPVDGATSVPAIAAAPGVRLDQNRPNPFGGATRIDFELPAAGRTSLRIYDVAGREAATLLDGTLPAGRHTLELKPGALGAGVYSYRLETPQGVLTRKMVVLR